MTGSGKSALVTGAGGFIGGHLVGRLLRDGYRVYAVDIKERGDWWQVHSSHVDDLTSAGSPLVEDIVNHVDVIFHLAANMGGMGFIENNLVACAENIIPTAKILHMTRSGQLFFFSSSACVYPLHIQDTDQDVRLIESWAVPANPEPGYGWEKLFAEQLCIYHGIERGIRPVIARFHNSYGPHGTWRGGREKAPAAICRKVATAEITGKLEIEIWGDGTQRRSFMYVDDNVEGILRLTQAAPNGPVNLGSARSITINELVDTVEAVAFGRPGVLKRIYVPGPLGVGSRNSHNGLLKSLTGWEPSTSLEVGIENTYAWIYDQLKKEL